MVFQESVIVNQAASHTILGTLRRHRFTVAVILAFICLDCVGGYIEWKAWFANTVPTAIEKQLQQLQNSTDKIMQQETSGYTNANSTLQQGSNSTSRQAGTVAQ